MVKVECFLFKFGNNAVVSPIPTASLHITGSSRKFNKVRKRNKRHTDWKGRYKSVHICR